jgi:hypothetical protein
MDLVIYQKMIYGEFAKKSVRVWHIYMAEALFTEISSHRTFFSWMIIVLR